MCDSVLSHLDSLFPELNLENPTCEIFNQPATYDDGTTVPNLLHYLPILTPCCGGDPNKLFNKGTSCSKFANFCADPNDYKEHLKLTEPTGQSELTCEGWLGYTNALLQAQDVSNPRCSMFRHPATHSNGRVVPNLLSWLGFLTPCCGEDIGKIFTDNSTDNALPLLFNSAPLWTIDRVQSGDCDGAVVETNVSIGQWIAGTNNDEYIQANFAFGTNCLSILHQSFLCDTTHVTRTEKICSNAECTNFIGNPVDFIRTRDEFDAYKTGKCHVADYGFGMTGYTFSVENNPLVELKVCESSYRFENFCADPHDYKGNFLINTPEGKATSCHQLLDVYDSLSPSIDLANPTCDMFQEGPLTLGNNTVIPNLLHALPMLTPCCGGDPSKLFIDNTPKMIPPVQFDNAPLWTWDRIQVNDCNGSILATNAPLFKWIPGRHTKDYFSMRSPGGNCHEFNYHSIDWNNTHFVLTENRCTTVGCTNVSESPSRIYPTRTIEYYNSILMSNPNECHQANDDKGVFGFTYSARNNPYVELRIKQQEQMQKQQQEQTKKKSPGGKIKTRNKT